MANFQVPDNRKFLPGDANLSPWPAKPDSYRFYVAGPGGEEKIGVQTGRKIEMQLIGARNYKIQTTEDLKINALLQRDGVNVTAAANSVPRFIRSSSVV